MSLCAIGKKLSDTFNALIAPVVIANLEAEKQAAEQGYVLVRTGRALYTYPIDPEQAKAVIARADKRLAEWKPRQFS